MGFKYLRFWLLVTTVVVTAKLQDDAAENQLPIFRNQTKVPIGIMTTAAGAPIDYSQTSTLNKRLILNEFFLESVTHTVRERIPERVVHAKGTGAFGYFEVTHNVSDICYADFLSKVGKKTPVAVRFSTDTGELGASDTPRETRGFAVKFYTEQGNFDIVGLSIPVFFFKDPIHFPSFLKTIKRNPATNLLDPNMFWDFASLHPETLHSFFQVFSDNGIPDGYRYMPGFSIHTYQIVNKCGENYFARFHFLPEKGVKTLSSKKAVELAGTDPDYSVRDLYNAIGRGEYPSWTVSLQVLSARDVAKADFDVFDVTKLLPLNKYPLRPIGRFTLNKNKINHFAEVEQSAFSPGNLVPGILGAPDKLFEARTLAYKDAQNYRLGANFLNIPVNCPLLTKPTTYNRDGVPPVGSNGRNLPNYYPNSFNGPIPYREVPSSRLIEIYEEQPNNVGQIRDYYLNGLTSGERKRMLDNILESLNQVTPYIQERVLHVFSIIRPQLAEIVSLGLKMNSTSSN